MRKLIAVIICLTVLLLGGYAGLRGYRVWKQKHFMTMAKDYLTKADGRNTLLCLSKVLAINSKNLEANRMMAAITEAARSPSTLIWRSKVMELNPGSLEDRLAVVRTAMSLRDLTTATNALNGVDEAGKKTAEYHQSAAAIDIMTGKFMDAEAHFQEVVRLKPQDPVPQLNLSILHLHSTNVQTSTEARAMLNVLCLNPTNANLRCLALRELISDAVQNKKTDTALALTKQLISDTNSAFSDRLLQLGVLKVSQRPEFTTALAACQRDAGTNSQKVFELASWQISQMSPTDGLTYMRTLPAAMQTNLPVALMVAQCREALKDWKGLDSSLLKQNWSDMEFVRYAIRTRALRSLNLDSAAKLEWDQAMKAANGQKQSLVTLLRLAAGWNWASDAEAILSDIITRFPNEQWAVQALMQSYYANGQTRPLMAIFSKQLQKSPNNQGIKNNLAMIGLLLDAKEINPHEMARQVYQGSPTNATFASTYAFSLYLQKKNPEALKVLESLQPAALQDPSVAGYYGLVLQASGDKAKSRQYLDLASKGKLLPEERKIMEAARNKT